MKSHWLLTSLLASTMHSAQLCAQEVPKEMIKIPRLLEPSVPAQCQQVALVLTPTAQSIPGRLWLLERADEASPWRSTAGVIPVSVGRNGLAWGDGEHSADSPAGFRIKKEGDGCSPAGVFRFPFAFGYASKNEAADIRVPYIPLSKTMFAVDDSQSRYYNQVVDTLKVSKDWRSAETMRRDDWLYRWGVYVAHNPRNRAFRGSCISLHIWRGPEQPTAGCTAMAEEHMRQVLAWLDPAKEPRLVQGIESW